MSIYLLHENDEINAEIHTEEDRLLCMDDIKIHLALMRNGLSKNSSDTRITWETSIKRRLSLEWMSESSSHLQMIEDYFVNLDKKQSSRPKMTSVQMTYFRKMIDYLTGYIDDTGIKYIFSYGNKDDLSTFHNTRTFNSVYSFNEKQYLLSKEEDKKIKVFDKIIESGGKLDITNEEKFYAR